MTSGNENGENKKQEEVKYPVGEERLIIGGQRNEFADFELKLRVDNLTRHLRYALEEVLDLQNMIYFLQMESRQDTPSDEEKKK